MKTVSAAKRLVATLMEEFEDDHVGLWSVAKQVQRAFPNAKMDDVRRKTLSAIGFLLELGLIEAGFPTKDGRGFEAWRQTPYRVVRRIASEWKAVERLPSIGEIVWFTTPTQSESRTRAG